MYVLATSSGAVVWDEALGPWKPAGPEGEEIRHVAAADGDQRFAAVARSGVVWEHSGPAAWEARPLPRGAGRAACLLASPDGETLYAGTEPAALYRKRWGDPAWQEVCVLYGLPLARGWHTPWGGPAAVRTMAPGANAGTLFLDIHVGGIARTRDAGRTWESVNAGLDEDVHEAATHPLAPGRVYAATADGFYLSEDEGATWRRRNQGLSNLYCRGIAAHPEDPDVILISGSPTAPPGWRQQGPRFSLFRTTDAGRSWTPVTEGLPDPFPSVVDTHGIAFSPLRPGHVLCAAGGVLYASEDAGIRWQRVEAGLPAVHAVHAFQAAGAEAGA